MGPFATLQEAIDWASSRWNERPAPVRLHVRDMEGTGPTRDRKGCRCLGCTLDGATDAALGSHAFSGSFGRHLDGRPNDTIYAAVSEPCYHAALPIGRSLFDCGVLRDDEGKPVYAEWGCHGTGWKTATRERWRWPMWRAFSKLVNARNETPKHPHPAVLVMALAGADWDYAAAATRIERPVEVAEALFLRALRQLHGRYEEGPVGRVSWVDKSQSQQRAEEAVA